MNITTRIQKELGLEAWQVDAVIRLMEEGNTIPFIARYRKEAHGALSDETLRQLEERWHYLCKLEERKEVVRASMEEQAVLTEELRRKLEKAETAVEVEDLYRPYKPKRRTRAVIAKEKGMEPLAEYILMPGKGDAVREAVRYVDPEKEIDDEKTALQLAEDIIAGEVADRAEWRSHLRKSAAKSGILTTTLTTAAKKNPEDGMKVYENYFDFEESAAKLPGHRILAINRAEKEKILSVKLEVSKEAAEEYLCRALHTDRLGPNQVYAEEAVRDAYQRLMAPSIETEIRSMLTERAEDGAIKVFQSNLEQLLMQPPMEGKTVLGWDPAFRTGCKLAVVDPTGKVLETKVIYPVAPQNKTKEAFEVLARLVTRYGVDIIAVGNGTASRESEQVITDFIRAYQGGMYGKPKKKLQYVIVNEAGASVYSASKVATEEHPDLDVGERSSASIARRLQDPLAELVKIDPRSIGVGQYQHDMDRKKLGEALEHVVEDCVNRVGVDLNTASPSLLQYISGISKTTATNIVKYREEHGRFRTRKELLKVAKLGPKAYEQCAGFLRIREGKEALDATAVHPESYPAARELLKLLGYTEEDIRSGATADIRERLLHEAKIKKGREIPERTLRETADRIGIGVFTLRDIIEEIEKPGRDPRSEAEAPILRSDVLSMEDLEPGMELRGTVRNIVDFGAFVDIGVHQDGLVHISELSDRFVKHPLDVVKVGDIVNVRVLKVDRERGKISLTMKSPKKN